MLKDIVPEAKSIVGLSNISNGTPIHLRPVLNRTYLVMLMKYVFIRQSSMPTMKSC